MKRVHLNTPGKMLQWRNSNLVRTPVFFDIVIDKDVDALISYAELMGVRDFWVEEIEDSVVDPETKKKRKGPGLKNVRIGGAGGMKLKVSV